MNTSVTNFIVKIFLGLTLVFTLNSCETEGTVVQGTIENHNNLTLFFDKMHLNNNINTLDKQDLSGNGSFKIAVKEGLDAGVYRVRVGTKKAYLIFDGTESKVTFDADMNTMENAKAQVTGSQSSSDYLAAMSEFMDARSNPATLGKVQDNVKAAALSSANPLVGMMLSIQALGTGEKYIKDMKTISTKVAEKYPTSSYKTDFNKFVASVEQNAMRKTVNQRIQVGMQAPNISLPNPDGKMYTLEELKGKVVLLDFWASWCGPCRKANPHVVETYKKYEKKGFTVFSVSLDGLDSRTKARFGGDESMIQKQLDSSKDRWVSAINKDGLLWDYHVSDLKKWECAPAREYGVSGIPKTFLIDRDGKIAAINPRYNLEEELLKVL